MSGKTEYMAMMCGQASAAHCHTLFDAAPAGLGAVGIVSTVLSVMKVLGSSNFAKIVADVATILMSIKNGTFNLGATAQLLETDQTAAIAVVMQIAAAFGLTPPMMAA